MDIHMFQKWAMFHIVLYDYPWGHSVDHLRRSALWVVVDVQLHQLNPYRSTCISILYGTPFEWLGTRHHRRLYWLCCCSHRWAQPFGADVTYFWNSFIHCIPPFRTVCIFFCVPSGCSYLWPSRHLTWNGSSKAVCFPGHHRQWSHVWNDDLCRIPII